MGTLMARWASSTGTVSALSMALVGAGEAVGVGHVEVVAAEGPDHVDELLGVVGGLACGAPAGAGAAGRRRR